MAKKFIFLKTETSVSKHWADAAETFRTFYDAPVAASMDSTKIQDYTQVISSYVKISSKIRLLSNDQGIMLGVATVDPSAGVGLHPIQTDLITSALESGYKAVYLGFDFGGSEITNEMDIVNASTYFGRRMDGRLVELKTNKEIAESINAAVFFAAYKLTNLPFYYFIFNPNLADLSNTIDRDIGETTYRSLNTHDGSLKDALFSPTFSNKLIQVGDNVLAALADEFTIKPFGNSMLNYIGVGDDVKSKLNLRADAVGVTVTIRGSELDIKMNGNSAVVSFSWPVGSENWGATPNSDQLLRRSYLITKLG